MTEVMEEYLELASSVRVVLAELAEHLAQALKDEAELDHALKTLLSTKDKKGQLTTPRQRSLNSQSEGFDQSFGQRDRSKVVLWIEVIFTRLIFYADQPMSRGGAIRHVLINLA